MIDLFLKHIPHNYDTILTNLVGSPYIFKRKKVIYSLLCDARFENNRNDMYLDVLKSPLKQHITEDIFAYKYLKSVCQAELTTLPTIKSIDPNRNLLATSEFKFLKNISNIFDKKYYYIMSHSVTDKDLQSIPFITHMDKDRNVVKIITTKSNKNITLSDDVLFLDTLDIPKVLDIIKPEYDNIFLDIGPKVMSKYFKNECNFNPIDLFLLTTRDSSHKSKSEVIGNLCKIEEVFRFFDLQFEGNLINRYEANWKIFTFFKRKKKVNFKDKKIDTITQEIVNKEIEKMKDDIY